MSIPNFTLAASGKTFQNAGPGTYSATTVTFGSPRDYVRMNAGKTSTKSKLTSASIIRYLEKDVTVGSTVTRRNMIVQLSITTHPSFTPAEIDTAAAEISEFLTADRINYILTGGN